MKKSELRNIIREVIKENENMVDIKSFSNYIDGKVVGSRTKLKPKIKGDLIILPVEVFGEKLNVTLEIKPGKMNVYMHKPNEKYNSSGPRGFVYRNMSEKSLWDDLRYNYFEL